VGGVGEGRARKPNYKKKTYSEGACPASGIPGVGFLRV